MSSARILYLDKVTEKWIPFRTIEFSNRATDSKEVHLGKTRLSLMHTPFNHTLSVHNDTEGESLGFVAPTGGNEMKQEPGGEPALTRIDIETSEGTFRIYHASGGGKGTKSKEATPW